MKLRKISILLATVAAFAAPQIAQAQTVVDVELALLVDVSGSVDTTEFNLQRQGYVNAFNSAVLQSAFNSGRSAAVTLIYWSGAGQQQQTVGWTLINSAATSASFATAILAAGRPFSGGATNLGDAIGFAAPLFFNNAFNSDRQIIDVSGDGVDSEGAASSVNARNAALALGIDQINGLPILNNDATLLAFYQNNVQGGAGSFTIAADTFADFDAAVQQKIGREIVDNGVPEPATWAMMVMGFGAVGFAMRGRRQQTLRIRFV